MKAIVVYGSTGGNTQFLSEYVKLGLMDAGHEVSLQNVRDVQMNDLLAADLLVLGSSTWNLDKQQGQLQQDWRARLNDFMQLDLQNKPTAIFGVGSYHYTFTANAANLLVDAVKQVHGRVLEPIFKVDDVVDEFCEQIRAWGKQVGQSLL